MKTLRIIIGILLSIGTLVSILSFLTNTLINDEMPEIAGHFIAILIFVWLIKLCFTYKEKSA